MRWIMVPLRSHSHVHAVGVTGLEVSRLNVRAAAKARSKGLPIRQPPPKAAAAACAHSQGYNELAFVISSGLFSRLGPIPHAPCGCHLRRRRRGNEAVVALGTENAGERWSEVEAMDTGIAERKAASTC